MTDRSALRYRIFLESPASLGAATASFDDGSPARWSGASIRGALRSAFQHVCGADKELERIVFGSDSESGRLLVRDLLFDGLTSRHQHVAIDRVSGGAREGALSEVDLVPAGVMLLHEIIVDDNVPPSTATVLRSSIRMFETSGIGGSRARGYGRCQIDMLSDFPNVFVSYSHDSAEHRAWVRSLVNRLLRDGIEVVVDAYDLAYGQSIEEFMKRALRRAQKILVVLTPEYRTKAEQGSGGVGFEFPFIESFVVDAAAEGLKVLPILRRGDEKESVPKALNGRLLLAMTAERFEETKYTALYSAIMGLSSRPKSRFSDIKGLGAA